MPPRYPQRLGTTRVVTESARRVNQAGEGGPPPQVEDTVPRDDLLRTPPELHVTDDDESVADDDARIRPTRYEAESDDGREEFARRLRERRNRRLDDETARALAANDESSEEDNTGDAAPPPSPQAGAAPPPDVRIQNQAGAAPQPQAGSAPPPGAGTVATGNEQSFIGTLSMAAVITLVTKHLSGEMSYPLLIGILFAAAGSIHVLRNKINNIPSSSTDSKSVFKSEAKGLSIGANLVSWVTSGAVATITITLIGGGVITFALSLYASHSITHRLIDEYIQRVSGAKENEVKEFFKGIGRRIERDVVIDFLRRMLINSTPSRYDPPSTPGEAERRLMLVRSGIDYISILTAIITFGLTYRNTPWIEIASYTGLSFASIRSILSLYLSFMVKAKREDNLQKLKVQGVTDTTELATALAKDMVPEIATVDFFADVGVMGSRTMDVIKYVPLTLLAKALPETGKKIVEAVVGPAAAAAAIQWAVAARGVIDANVRPEGVINYVYDNSPLNRAIRASAYTSPFVLFIIASYFIIIAKTSVPHETLAAPFIICGLILTAVISAVMYRYIHTIDNFLLSILPPKIRDSHCMGKFCSRSQGHTDAELQANTRADQRIAETTAALDAEVARDAAAALLASAGGFTSAIAQPLSPTAGAPFPPARTAVNVDAAMLANFRAEPIQDVGSTSTYRLHHTDGQAHATIAEIKLYNDEDGRFSMTRTDGVIEEHYPDRRKELHRTDGFKEVHYADGTREISHPREGSAIFHPDGTSQSFPAVVVDQPEPQDHDSGADDNADDSSQDEEGSAGGEGGDSSSMGSGGGASIGSNWSIGPEISQNFSDAFQSSAPEIVNLFSSFGELQEEDGLFDSGEEEVPTEKMATIKVFGIEEEEEDDGLDEEEEIRGKKPEMKEVGKRDDVRLDEEITSGKLYIHPERHEKFDQKDDVTRFSWVEDDMAPVEILPVAVPVMRATHHMPLRATHSHHHTKISFSSYYYHAPVHIKAPSLSGHSAFDILADSLF